MHYRNLASERSVINYKIDQIFDGEVEANQEEYTDLLAIRDTYTKLMEEWKLKNLL